MLELLSFVDFPTHRTSSSRGSVAFCCRDKNFKMCTRNSSLHFSSVAFVRSCVLVRLSVFVCKGDVGLGQLRHGELSFAQALNAKRVEVHALRPKSPILWRRSRLRIARLVFENY